MHSSKSNVSVVKCSFQPFSLLLGINSGEYSLIVMWISTCSTHSDTEVSKMDSGVLYQSKQVFLVLKSPGPQMSSTNERSEVE